MARTVEEHQKKGSRFRLIDLIFCVTVLTIILSLLPLLQRSSDRGGRRTQCGNNLRQLGLSLMNYESAHGHFPAVLGDAVFANAETVTNRERLSGLILLLPYLEQSSLYDQICGPYSANGVNYPAFGPAVSDTGYRPWQSPLRIFECPSSQKQDTGIGPTNYAFCIGDRSIGIHQPNHARGAFGFGKNMRIRDFVDGASQSIAMAEIGNSNGSRRLIGNVAIHQPASLLSTPGKAASLEVQFTNRYYAKGIRLGTVGRGGRWFDGAANYSLFNTVLPPNGPSLAIGGVEAVDGFYSAGSEHPGGIINALFMDGSNLTISQNIDCGKADTVPLNTQQMEANAPSPFGVWGALGTINGNDDSSEWYQ